MYRPVFGIGPSPAITRGNPPYIQDQSSSSLPIPTALTLSKPEPTSGWLTDKSGTKYRNRGRRRTDINLLAPLEL